MKLTKFLKMLQRSSSQLDIEWEIYDGCIRAMGKDFPITHCPLTAVYSMKTGVPLELEEDFYLNDFPYVEKELDIENHPMVSLAIAFGSDGLGYPKMRKLLLKTL